MFTKETLKGLNDRVFVMLSSMQGCLCNHRCGVHYSVHAHLHTSLMEFLKIIRIIISKFRKPQSSFVVSFYIYKQERRIISPL